MSSRTRTTTTPSDVLLYIPNIIGYSRVLFTLCSFVIMLAVDNNNTSSYSSSSDSSSLWPFIAISLYIASFVGDLFDGLIARKLNQTSEFGSLLDMITDRCSTMGLLFVLSSSKYYSNKDYEFRYPIYKLTFLSLTLLDISSHWCQMYSTSASNTNGNHHKSAEGNKGRHFLVRWFYQYYYFFGYLCVGAEFTYIISYMLAYLDDNGSDSKSIDSHTIAIYVLYLCLPGCILKQAVNIMQLCSACYAVAYNDATNKNK